MERFQGKAKRIVDLRENINKRTETIRPAKKLFRRIDTMKKLLLGNEAVASGLYEAGCRVVSSYPGTPSTEITEYAGKYDEMYCRVGAQ